jgi:Fe-S cluster biogenesis protein NfuA
MLQRDGGDIEFVSVDENGTVKVRLKGACGSCPMSTMTLKMGVEKFLKEQVPAVKEVVQVA